MRYHVLASDYDGTLAHHGAVDAPTLAMMKKLLATGRRMLLVTGRELPELKGVFPEIDLFEWVVAENGGLLYHPGTKEEKLLAEPPPPEFVDMLRRRGVNRISVGRVIVATWEPFENIVLDTIRDMGLELQVIFNKGAVMVLPAGVNKATGLAAALREMSLSPHNVVGVGDAENDHAMLRYCELSTAVSNALQAVKDTADLVTEADHGAGVCQLIERMIDNDLADFDKVLSRHHLPLGKSGTEEIKLSPYGRNVLICGPSASGKSTVATRIVESLLESKHQFCLIDPEGDYAEFDGAVVFGGPKSPPSQDEILRLLEKPRANAVVCLTGMSIPDRPQFFLNLFANLLQMRARLGRPHWIVLDEAHHLMPADWSPPKGMLPEQLLNTLLITVHPQMLSKMLLERVNTIIGVGPTAAQTLQSYAEASGHPLPEYEPIPVTQGETLFWRSDTKTPPLKLVVHPCKMERHRHRRKYAEGELPPDRSFYFRGPDEKLNLRAQNLILFLQIADGVDDATWDHHLKIGDYSKWFREGIKDAALAASAERIEQLTDSPAKETRALIRAAVERDYTLPSTGPMPVPGAS